MKAHPAAEIFPLLTSIDMANLAKSIREDGQKFPIIVHEGLILDGRNRFRACQISGIDPWTEEWDGEGSPTAFVIAANLHRRHLDESQRGIVAGRATKMFEAEAAERQRESWKNRGRDVPANLPERGEAREKAAALLNVSPRTAENGKRVVDRGVPELVEAVERGEVSVSAAAEVAKLPATKQSAIVKKGAAAIVEVAKEQRRPKDNSDELFDEFKRIWNRAGDDVRKRIVEHIER